MFIVIFNYAIFNDKNCSQVNDLTSRNKIKIIESDLNCGWLIVGADYTGLSSLRKLDQIHPNQKIILVDP